MLRYIYNLGYRRTGGDPSVWEHWKPHFEVYRTAQKYLMVELQEKALKHLTVAPRPLEDPAEIVEVLSAFRTDGIDAVDDNFAPLEKKILGRRLVHLVGHEDFMALLEEDPALMGRCMTMFKNNEHLQACKLSTCSHCGDQLFAHGSSHIETRCNQ
jgi:hypothetical protein